MGGRQLEGGESAVSCRFFWNPVFSHPAPNRPFILKRRRQQTKQTDPRGRRRSRRGRGTSSPLGRDLASEARFDVVGPIQPAPVCFSALFRVLCACACVPIACSRRMNGAGAIHFTSLKTLGFQKARGRLLAGRSARGDGGCGPWRIHFKGQEFTRQSCLLVTMEESILCL